MAPEEVQRVLQEPANAVRPSVPACHVPSKLRGLGLTCPPPFSLSHAYTPSLYISAPLPSSQHCCDCDEENPQWAAVRHGAFVCIRCAAIHRALGVTHTIIRSVMLDSWSEDEVQCMVQGGNAALKEMMAEAGVPADLPARDKYRTATLAAYAARLRAMATGQELPAGPIPTYTPPPKMEEDVDVTMAPAGRGGDGSVEGGSTPGRRRPGESPLECWHREKYGYGSNESACDRCLRHVAVVTQICDCCLTASHQPLSQG